MGNNTRGALIALLSFAIYATSDATVKSLGGTYSPFQLIFFTQLFSFPLVMLMMITDPKTGNLRPVHPWWVALRSLSAVIAGFCAFYAFSNMPLAQVYSIIFASPLIITLLAIPILGEKVGIHRMAAVIVGLIGVIVVIRPGSAALSTGHIAAIVAAFAGGFNSIIMRKIGGEERPVVMLLYPMITNFIIMACALPFVYIPMPIEHLAAIGALSVLGWLGGLLMIRAYRLGEAVIVAPMQYSQIIWASLYGYLFFNELLDGTTILGTSIIIASGLYIVLRETWSGRSANRPVLNAKMRPETAAMPRPSLLARFTHRHDEKPSGS